MSDDFEDDLWVLFEAESLEHCTNCEDHLFGDDEETTPGERLNTLFRAFHSLKSLASSMGMQNMVELAHACEDILGAARNGHISITSDIKSGLIEATDLMRQLVVTTVAQRKPAMIDGVISCLENLKMIAAGSETIAEPDSLVSMNSAVPANNTQDETADGSDASSGQSGGAQASSDRFVRVASDSLDNLFRLSGTLVAKAAVLAKITHNAAGVTAGLPADQSQQLIEIRNQLEKVSRDIDFLNTAVADLRLVPLDDLARRLRRTAFDTARKVNKDIELAVDGEEMRADRAIVRTLTDPLLHMVRNAVDHGLEAPAGRGDKPQAGKVQVSFSRSGSSLKILIKDDGRGLDVERIRQIAIERRRLTASEANEMSDSQMQRLIFEPGFSTASQLDATSGRGVGMDVVFRNISLIGGEIEIASDVGKGTAFSITVPGATSTEACVVLSALTPIYAIPSRVVVWIKSAGELETEQRRGIEYVHHENHQIPIQQVHMLTGSQQNTTSLTDVKIILLHVLGFYFALKYQGGVEFADLVFEEPDLFISKLPMVSGTTITDASNVIFRLDVEKLDQMMHDRS